MDVKQPADAGQDIPRAGAWTPPADQAELDRIVQDRVARERAKYAGHDEFKAKARKYDEWQASQQTGEQRADAAMASLTAERDQAVARLARVEAAAKHGLAAGDIDFIGGTTADEIEASAAKLAQRLQTAGQPRRPRPDPAQGRERDASAGTGGELRDFTREFFNRT
ncbi:MAG: hypothetical protein LBK42_13800 [Propionibacteriaceae bacterium]|jgi:hypothetical protein|nr:hypothetical protein [Propionibacteriaceae bacterium]